MRFRRLGSFATIAIAGAVLVPLLHAQQGTQPSVTAVRQATTMAGRFGLTYTDVRIESLPDRQVRITLTGRAKESITIDALAITAAPTADGFQLSTSGLARIAGGTSDPLMTAEGLTITLKPDGAVVMQAARLNIER